jgi:isopentenyl-diphosphate delta-isomerase type 1
MSVSEELFDVVDGHDDVIGIRTRSEVHRLKLLHRAVHVFLFRPDGMMLIHQRSPTKEEFPSVWTSSCSGHVSSGETYDETAPRELFEELGIQAAVKRLQKFPACEDTSFEFTVLYHTESADPVRPDPDEITDIRWLPPDRIAAWIQSAPEDFSPAFRLLFAWYISSDTHPDLAYR